MTRPPATGTSKRSEEAMELFMYFVTSFATWYHVVNVKCTDIVTSNIIYVCLSVCLSDNYRFVNRLLQRYFVFAAMLRMNACLSYLAETLLMPLIAFTSLMTSICISLPVESLSGTPALWLQGSLPLAGLDTRNSSRWPWRRSNIRTNALQRIRKFTEGHIAWLVLVA